jgi:hypothetical protein
MYCEATMSKRWVGLGLIVATLSGAGPARAQFTPGAFGPPAAPPPAAPTTPFGAPGAFNVPAPAPGQAPAGPFGAAGAFTPPPMSPGGFGPGGAFTPEHPGAFGEGMPAPDGGAPAPCIEDRPCYRNLFGKSEPGVCQPCFSIYGEFLFLWARGNKLDIPTLTAGNINDSVPGAIGQPGTQVLLGNSTYSVNSPTPAYRIGGTYWCSPGHLAIDGNVFYAQTMQVNTAFEVPGSPGSGVIARPFFNTGLNREDADPRGVANALGGNVSQGFTTRLYGGEVNLRWVVNDCGDAWYCPCFSVLAGARAIKLDDNFTMADRVSELPFGTGTTTTISDAFTTYNQFYGGQLGGMLSCRWDERMITTVTGKVAYGPDFQTVKINGGTTQTDLNGNVTGGSGFGLFSQRSNIGTYHRTGQALVPELDLNMGVDINEHIRFKVGYSLVYMIGVVRPGDQIDRSTNPQPLGPLPNVLGLGTHPTPPSFSTTNFWYQLVNVGMEFTF